jgi:hypothetical protein
MNYDEFFADAIGRLWHERRYRVFVDLERIAGRFPRAIWHFHRKARVRSSSGAPTIISAWANIRK